MKKAKKNLTRKQRILHNILVSLILIFLIFILLGFLPGIDVSRYQYFSDKVPKAFDDFTILQISDLHCEEFGKDQAKLIKKIDAQKPDIIVFTGDLIDNYHDSIEPTVKLIRALAEKDYVMYRVSGNHEPDRHTFKNELDSVCRECGVTDLDDKTITISKGMQSIRLCGFAWCVPAKYADMPTSNKKYVLPYENPDTDMLNILLNHNASVFPYIADLNFNLILAGHLHGGVIRLPFIGGLIDNSHGISLGCKYGAGVTTINACTQITSRGLGDAIIPVPRFYNRPELVVVTLKSTGE